MNASPKNKDECVCRLMRDSARALTNAYDKALAPSGLRSTQFTLLSVLARHSEASVNQLSELLGIDQTTTTRNISILEDAGLIVRVPHTDPRVKLMKLTAKGKQKSKVAAECWQELQNHVVASVSEADWKTFQKVLGSFENGIKDWSNRDNP